MRRIIPGFLEITALAGLVLACESGVEPPPDVSVLEPTATELAGAAGAALPGAVAVRALDGAGAPAAGVAVRFAVVTGGGSVSEAEVRTGADGVARTVWMLGPALGEQVLRAEVRGASVLIRAAVRAGEPAVVRVLAGEGQSGFAGERLPVEPMVRVEDAHGNPVEGATVRFSAESGLVEAAEVVADAAGRASGGGWTLGGGAGAQTLSVAAGSASGAITAIALPAAPAALRVQAGQGQSAAVGTAVPIAPAIVVEDAFGNVIPGVAVRFEIEQGGGAIVGSSPDGASLVELTELTDGLGIARVPVWTLGTVAGPNVLMARAAGIEAVKITGTGLAGPPAGMVAVAPVDQSAPAGGVAGTAPSVVIRDGFGNAVAGVEVTFSVTGGGGRVAVGTAVTDAQGVAGAGEWTLGTSPGANTVRATAAGLAPITFRASGTSATAVSVAVVAGNDQVAPVNTTLPTAPAVVVRDGAGHGVPGVAVEFTVVSGGGVVTGGSVLTDASGVGRAGSWQLGSAAGVNVLSARAGSLPPVAFQATGTAGAVAALAKQQGDDQSAPAGTSVPVRPSVIARDAHGNAVPGIAVTFSVTNGGGSVSGAVAVTNALGVATVGGWTLGGSPGGNALSASAVGVAAVVFNATATAGGDGSGGDGGYAIDVRYVTSVTARQQQAFDGAAAKWSTLVIGDVPNVNLTIPAGVCGAPAGFSELVDDLVIFVEVKPIDGPGRILGSAGPCYIRMQGGLPIAGIISLDAADLATMESNGTLDDVVAHEMGHVIGLGTVWGGAVTGAGGGDPYFGRAGAVAAFLAAGGSAYGGNPVPVENTGGAGTRDAHWRESVMLNELMTGYIAGAGNPLSAITVAALGDLGYSVNPSLADGYAVTFGAPSSEAAGATEQRIRLEEAAPPPVQRVDASGRIQR